MSTPFSTEQGRLVWRGDGETLVVEPWGADSARVRAALGEVHEADWALLPPPHQDAATIDLGELSPHGDAEATLTNGGVRVVLTARSRHDAQAGYLRHFCHVSIQDEHGEVLLEEAGDGGALKIRAREYESLPGGSWRTTLRLRSPRDEKLYGMGQYQQEIGDLKGSTLELAHRNSQVSVPFVMSSRGYGLLWHTPAVGRATFGMNRTEWVAESAVQFDYWVTAAGSPAQVSRRYAEATGHAPMMPEYGLGFWQSKLRYTHQEELLEVAREYRRRGLPLDVIVADFFHWPHLGDFRFDEEFWPDPAAMVRELRELGIELMVSVWPQISPDSENFAQLSSHGMLVSSDRGVDVQMAFGGPSRFLDVTSAEAREFLWKKLTEGYGRHGVRLYWLDEAEPEYALYDYAAYRTSAGPVTQVGGIYPQHFSRAVAEGLQTQGESPLALVRCAWAGSQRYGALVWSGDIPSTWEALRQQLIAGIHMGVAGIPWFTTDIGGFAGGRPEDPAYQELLVRWFQFGTFLPVMRLHGDRGPAREVRAADDSPRMHSGAANEPWSFGSETTPVLERYLRLREQLRPYLREVMTAAHLDGQPVMRGLFHEFPEDDAAWEIIDQFMLGPDLLVAPVLGAGERSRRIYLPAGAHWTSALTGTVHAGGQWIDEAAPIESIPVFTREHALQELTASLAAQGAR